MSRTLPKITRLEEVVAKVAEWHDQTEKLFRVLSEEADRTGNRESQLEMRRRLREFTAVREFLQSMLNKQRGIGLELLPEDLDGLPPELVAELSISDSDQQEIEILKLIEAEGGAISLDLLLVRWYRAKGAIIKRKALTSRLYRMQQKGRIFAVEGTKGIYSLLKQEEMPLGEPNESRDGLEEELT